ncbi:trace amine-associated receptor 6-like isoform X3 [Panthera leo]|uniref:trace amine-associated receptor 6-like isoform X3 n=1 Tax=Panthera leo TaxID=9689 RepID=UPI001C695654|nr:trace amine-associated receptor 6-like isoform X3 [Panthera leo]
MSSTGPDDFIQNPQFFPPLSSTQQIFIENLSCARYCSQSSTYPGNKKPLCLVRLAKGRTSPRLQAVCSSTMSTNPSPAASEQLCYQNVTGSCAKALYSPGPRLILYTLFSLGAVLAVFGNLLVVISILHFKQLHSPTNFLIASLACADFLVGVTVMPFSMVRYIAVTEPLVYPTKFTVSVSGTCIGISWILPLVYSGAVFFTGVHDDGLEELVSALSCIGGCRPLINQFWILIDLLLFFTPTFVMMMLYSNIFLVARKQAIKIENISSKTEASGTYKTRVSKRERKAAKTLGITVVAFLISWLPYMIDSFIDSFGGFITPSYVYEIFCWLGYYNSAVNPLIYALFYPWFRRAIKLIISGQALRVDSSSTMNLFSKKP